MQNKEEKDTENKDKIKKKLISDLREKFKDDIEKLKNATEQDNLAQVKEVIKGFEDKELPEEHIKIILNLRIKGGGYRLLHISAENGYRKITKYLVEEGANKNPKNRFGDTPYHLANLKGHRDVANFLGRSLRYSTNKELVSAAKEGDLEKVKLLTDKVDADPFRDDSLVYVFKDSNLCEVNDHLEKLLNKEFITILDDNDFRSFKHLWPYFSSIRFGLLGLELDSFKKSQDNLCLANKIVELVKKSKLSDWISGDYKLAEILLESKADPNQKGLHGYSPLNKAAKEGSLKLMKLFVMYGANTNHEFIYWPLISSIGKKSEEKMKYLLEKKADPNYYEDESFVPLGRACFSESFDIVKLLLDAKANPNFVGSIQMPVFHYPVRRGLLPIVKSFVESKVDVNVTDYNGRTALHIAAINTQRDVYTYLKSVGADPALRDKNKCTPLEYDIPNNDF